MNIRYSRLIVLLALIILGGAIGTAVYMYTGKQGPIYDFDETRDTKEILKIFDRDRYWLLSSPDYSPEFMLKHRTPNQDLQYMGRLNIKVYWEHDKFVGFTAYYMKTSELGCILFFDINPEFRGKDKGHAEKLMRYAIDQLKKMGAHQVELFVRVDNDRAQKFYKRMGFYQTSRSNVIGIFMQYDF